MDWTIEPEDTGSIMLFKLMRAEVDACVVAVANIPWAMDELSGEFVSKVSEIKSNSISAQGRLDITEAARKSMSNLKVGSGEARLLVSMSKQLLISCASKKAKILTRLFGREVVL